jgi:two-component system chemotaxis response regulator CheY
MSRSGTVLVVDDDVGCRAFLGEFLGLLGYRVESVGDGLEALEHLSDPAQRPCVIVLDLMMPVMSGWEFRREQARDARLADIPVVLISGVVKDLGREAEAVQVRDYLIKPFDLNALAAAIGRHCIELPA